MTESSWSHLLPANTVTRECPKMEYATMEDAKPRGMNRLVNDRMAAVVSHKESCSVSGKDSFDTSPEGSDEDHENTKPGVEVELTLIIPTGPRSSIGLRLSSSDIAGVAHASAAERAGLRVADRILSVQGELAHFAPPIIRRTVYPQRTQSVLTAHPNCTQRQPQLSPKAHPQRTLSAPTASNI